MSITFEYFIYGIIYAVIFIGVGTILIRLLVKLNRMENKLVNKTAKQTLKEIEDFWWAVRLAITVVFLIFCWSWGSLIADLVGYHYTKSVFVGYTLLFHSVVMILAISALVRLCWFLARLWLKGVAPKIYEIYKPYYSPNLRKRIVDSNELITRFTTDTD
jgi:magnesium-transporting ATPase (P-type)